MNPLISAMTRSKDFVIDYCQRHAHPVNAVLHIFGVPMAFYGLFRLVCGHIAEGLVLLTGGYVLQYVGHRTQGNEVGEVTLIKTIWKRLTNKQPSVTAAASPEREAEQLGR